MACYLKRDNPNVFFLQGFPHVDLNFILSRLAPTSRYVLCNQASQHLIKDDLYALQLQHGFTSMATQTYSLFCIGNPLLDMQVTNGEELLKKYDLKANDAILAEAKHQPM